MAATANPVVPLDITRTAEYPIVLSERLLKNTHEAERRYATVQGIFRHSPISTLPDIKSLVNGSKKIPSSATTTIYPAWETDSDERNLIVTDESGQNEDVYAGTQQEPSTKYILIFDPQTQTFTLDKVDADFNFNPQTHLDNDTTATAHSQHPQLESQAPIVGSSDEDVFVDPNDEHDSDEPDPDNGYDYRHYLKRHRTPSTEPLEQEDDYGEIEEAAEVRSLTPDYQPQPRTKRSHRSQPEQNSSPPREEADADNEESDDGGLTIIDPGKKLRHRYTAEYDSTAAPISLRSAASSIRKANSSEEESDGDVDDMKLPSPLGRDGRLQQEDVAVEEEDDDGGLEAELERELERGVAETLGQEIGEARVESYAVESSSESEEE